MMHRYAIQVSLEIVLIAIFGLFMFYLGTQL